MNDITNCFLESDCTLEDLKKVRDFLNGVIGVIEMYQERTDIEKYKQMTIEEKMKQLSVTT